MGRDGDEESERRFRIRAAGVGEGFEAMRGRRNFAFDEAAKERLLAVEIEIDRAFRNPGARSDIVDPRRVEAFLGEDGEGGVEDFVGARLGAAAEFRGPALFAFSLRLPAAGFLVVRVIGII